MRKSVKLWLKALRSGRYAQTTGVLHDKDGYCCLGVACAVYNKTHKKKVRFGEGYEVLSLQEDKSCVRHWLGLQNPHGRYFQEDKSIILANLNDQWITFKKIADIIESNPKDLFVATTKEK
jgi:hypothetical protein